ncbi:MAG: hypothetical protein KF704_01885 [Crocinitomicaceae bacterium]|nr:hypothetical protein [Crocinitomicaceae bacterium]
MSSNRALIREKLRDFDAIYTRYRGTQKPNERFALRMLKQERRHIERQLYPNLLIRLTRRIVIKPIRNLFVRRANRKREKRKSESLYNQLSKAGLRDQFNNAERIMRQHSQDFSLPVSYQANEKQRVDQTLQFEMDGKGAYKAVSLTASLHDDTKPKKDVKQTFDLRKYPGIGAREAFNLLDGRSVLLNGKWLQLDLTDRDTQGNYRIIEYVDRSQNGLTDALNSMPFKELYLTADRAKAMEELKRGERMTVTHANGGKEQRFHLEANPRMGNVNILDDNLQQVSLSQVNGKKVSPAQSQKQGIKNGVKRPGIRIA